MEILILVFTANLFIAIGHDLHFICMIDKTIFHELSTVADLDMCLLISGSNLEALICKFRFRIFIEQRSQRQDQLSHKNLNPGRVALFAVRAYARKNCFADVHTFSLYEPGVCARTALNHFSLAVQSN